MNQRTNPADLRLRIYPAHSFGHDDDLQAVIDLLEPDWVQNRDYVITAPRTHDRIETGGDTKLLLGEMIELIADADVLWAMAGGYASRSKFIEFENRATELLGRPAIALPWHGQKRLSTVATNDGEREIARRNRASIIEKTLAALPAWRRVEFEAPLAGIGEAFRPVRFDHDGAVRRRLGAERPQHGDVHDLIALAPASFERLATKSQRSLPAPWLDMNDIPSLPPVRRLGQVGTLRRVIKRALEDE